LPRPPRTGLAFHYAVLENREQVDASIARLRTLTRSGDYASYVDIAHFMGDLPLPSADPASAVA
jgi:hypothetical protein